MGWGGVDLSSVACGDSVTIYPIHPPPPPQLVNKCCRKPSVCVCVCPSETVCDFLPLCPQVTMVDRGAAERACKDANPIIDGRKANVNLAYLGAKPRSWQAGEAPLSRSNA